MRTYVYAFLSVACYVILCKLFIGAFEENRTEWKRGHRYLILSGLMLLNFGMAEFVTDHLLINQFLMFGSTAFVMQVLFKGKRIKVFMLTLLYHSGSLLIDYAADFFILNYVPEPAFHGMPVLTPDVTSNMLSGNVRFCLIICLTLYLRKNNIEYLKKMEQLCLMGFSAFNVIIILFHLEMLINRIENKSWYLTVGLLILNVVMSSLLKDRVKHILWQSKERQFRDKAENETRLYRMISESYEKQRKREHEYKNQILCITALAQEEKYQELNEYLTGIEKKLTGSMELFDTNHSIVNTILNLKYQEARKKGILFVVKINDLSEIPITDEDIVIILSNLLDNALEACEQCEDKIVKLKFIKEYNKIIISVTNTLIKPPRKMGGTFRTGKSEHPEKHGFGITNICEAVERYGGSYAITYDDKEFRFAILIYCNGNSIAMNAVL